MINEIVITKTIEIFTHQLKEGFNIVRARWKGNEEYCATIVHDQNMPLVQDITTPTELYVLTDSIVVGRTKRTYEANEDIKAFVQIIYCDPDDFIPAIFSYHKDAEKKYFVLTAGFETIPNDAYGLIYYANCDNTYYDMTGALLNNSYSDSILDNNYDLKAIVRDAEKLSDILSIKPHREWDDGGTPIYYVWGNGDTLNIKLHMTPDEYRRYRLEGFMHSVVTRFLTDKLGDDAKLYIREKEDEE